MKHYRHGDVNLHEIAVIPKTARKLEHKGEWILARGEATGSVHKIRVTNPDNMDIYQDADGTIYVSLREKAQVTHTSDHEIIEVDLRNYVQVPEREKDWFADGITRKVQD